MDVARNVYTFTAHTLSTKLQRGTPEFYMIWMPVVVYWLVAGFYELLEYLDMSAWQRFRIQRKTGAGLKNRITKSHVVGRVLLQQAIQVLILVIALLLDPEQCAVPPPTWVQACLQFGLGMLVMDTWQYFIHRWMHINTYLYKNVHSTHHRLNIPYAIGALYNHPVEALALDTLGGLVSLLTTGMGCNVATCLFTFATIKTVLDHCGWRFPVNLLHNLLPNSAAYHDVHHDVRGIKKNFSQPFFTVWDQLLGTYMDPAQFHLSPAEIAAAQAEGKKQT